MEPTPTFHDAHSTVQQNQISELMRRSRPEAKDSFHWQDPLRDFESLGQFVPVELRYWIQQSEETRLAWLRVRADDHYVNKPHPGEEPVAFQARMNIAWRDLSYVIGEELKSYVRPEFKGRGSTEVIKLALGLLVTPVEKVIAKRK